MADTKSFLFISIDGMTDPLGQSQVLPYLLGLAKSEKKIGIISCEKRENWKLQHKIIEQITNDAGICWDYCYYKTGKPFISQQQNYNSLKKLVFQKIKENNNQVVLHCRSYLAGLIGLKAKQKFGTHFIFDMRGFWADERTEGGIWNKFNPIGAYLYSYFKKKEKEMLVKSDAIICLTHKAKSIILNWNLAIKDSKISVIPCCADLSHFSKENIKTEQLTQLQNRYPKLKNKFVLSYVGSLGTWYMAEEMLEFFKILTQNTKAVFLIITKDDPSIIHQEAKKKGIDLENIIITPASRAEMPYYIKLSDASLFFIKPSFSKLASSPTKMGELLSMEVPVITNTGVGDVDSIINETNCGISIPSFNSTEYQRAVLDLLKNHNFYKKNTMMAANQFFSLKDGIEQYTKVYNSF